MSFENALAHLLRIHQARSEGDRRIRLDKGLGHGENHFLHMIWWEGFGNLEHLHPEYEVTDDLGRSRFIDFAYIFSWFKIAIEIRGYNPHSKQLSRWKFTDEQQRIRTLSSSGWILMYFSYDELRDEPDRCILEIQSLLGKLLGKEISQVSLTPIEKEIVHIALLRNGIVQAQQVCSEVGLHRNTAYRYLYGMVKLGWLEPIGDQRTTKYQLNIHKKHLFRS